MCLEEPGALMVDVLVVLSAIKLHDQFLRLTIVIDDVRRNRMLSTKFHTVQSSGTQRVPEFAFGIGSTLTQVARVLACSCG